LDEKNKAAEKKKIIGQEKTRNSNLLKKKIILKDIYIYDKNIKTV